MTKNIDFEKWFTEDPIFEEIFPKNTALIIVDVQYAKN
jgi:hypothetical protein